MKSVLDFAKAKTINELISMVTCYDYTSARIVESSSIDCILIGDSGAMTMHGFDSTLPATPEMIAAHTASVRRGAPSKFIVADMPFLAHRGSLDRTLEAARTIMTAGAQALKIEGIDGSEDVFKHIVQSGIPIIGHLGLTPQSVHQFGGFKVQATSPEAQEMLIQQALKVEAAGAFALVLECVPTSIAKIVTERLSIPTIGIGAGSGCSGQVLVFQDLLGLNRDFKPKFVRTFADGFGLFQQALNEYDQAVKAGTFPTEKESFNPGAAKATAAPAPEADITLYGSGSGASTKTPELST